MTGRRRVAGRQVFVYGTLQPGGRNAAVAGYARARYAFRAVLADAVLIALEPEGYPALLPGRGRVAGWVLEIRGGFGPLDALEGLGERPPHYRRVLWPLADRPLRVWVYQFARCERLRLGGVHRIVGTHRDAAVRWHGRGGAPRNLRIEGYRRFRIADPRRSANPSVEAQAVPGDGERSGICASDTTKSAS